MYTLKKLKNINIFLNNPGFYQTCSKLGIVQPEKPRRRLADAASIYVLARLYDGRVDRHILVSLLRIYSIQ